MKTISYPIYFIFITLLITQSYVWPTNASNTITAFFAEERPQRYHAGIDIRTYGKNGFEIYAIDNGYIQKIKTNYKGYGHTIYLKLDDGNVAVYAHLSEFYPAIESIIKIIKKSKNNQIIEHVFRKNELRVSKGEIIGLTGDTGSISGPHLHFEIRDENNISINPLINFYKIEDNIPPIPKQIAVIPKSKLTKTNNSSDIEIFDIIYKEEKYIIKDTISITGEFGLALNIFDKVDKQPFTYGLHQIELYIDGNMKYKISYNEHNFDQGHLVNNERNYYLKKIKDKRFYNLYASAPSLSFIDNRSWPSYKLEKGIHNIVIKASDINKNNTIIFGTIISENIKDLRYDIIEENDSIYIDIDISDLNNEYIINLCNKYNGEIINTIRSKEKLISISKKMLRDPYNTLEFYGTNINLLKTKKYYYQPINNKKYTIEGSFEIKTFKEGVLIQFIEDEFSNSKAFIKINTYEKNKKFNCKRIKQNIISTDLISYSDLIGLKNIEIEYQTKPKIKIKIKMNASVYIPDNGLYISNNDLFIDTQNNFIKDTSLLWLSDIEMIIPEDYRLISGPYKINPLTTLYTEKLKINFKSKNLIDGTGIYYLNDKKNKWIYLDTEYENNYYSTSILSNEVFCLLQELKAPVITKLIPDINATYQSEDINKIEFNINDDLSGIYNIKNISLSIDDEPVLFEYNSYQKKVFYNFEEELEIGKHLLFISVKDNVGNIVTKKGVFTIK